MPALSLLVLLARLVAPVHAAGTFTTKADLQAALQAVVCDENADAIAEYGAPDTWDVSAVTDMSELIWGLTCRATFNEVRIFHIALVGVVSPWRTTRQPLMTPTALVTSDCAAHRRSARGTSPRSRT